MTVALVLGALLAVGTLAVVLYPIFYGVSSAPTSIPSPRQIEREAAVAAFLGLRLGELEREQPSVDRQSDDEHERQRDEEDEAFRATAEPEVSRARNRPGRRAEEDERARLRMFGGGRWHDRLVYYGANPEKTTQPTHAPSGTPLSARVQLPGVSPVVHSYASVAIVGSAETSSAARADQGARLKPCATGDFTVR